MPTLCVVFEGPVLFSLLTFFGKTVTVTGPNILRLWKTVTGTAKDHLDCKRPLGLQKTTWTAKDHLDCKRPP